MEYLGHIKPPEAKILEIIALEMCQNEYLGHIKTAGGENFRNYSFKNVSQ